MPLRTSAGHTKIGSKLGPRIAHVVNRALKAHLQESAHQRAKIHADGLNQFHAQMSKELHQFVRPMLQQYADGLPDDHPAKQAVQFMASGHGEAQTILSLLSVSNAIGGGIGAGLADLLAPTNQDIMNGHPNQMLTANEYAVLAATRLMDYTQAQNEARRLGINADRFARMVELAQNFGDVSALLDLYNRRLINRTNLTDALHRQGFDLDWAEAFAQSNKRLLSPEQLADMVLRGWLDQNTGASHAALSGTDAADFDLLVKDTGEPPGTMQMLEGFRRGFIDQNTLQHGIRESRVRNEWIPLIEALRFEPMSTADAVRAVVENYLSSSDGQRIAEQNGLEPSHWPYLVESWGEPLAHGQMGELYHRGLVSRDQFVQAILESRTKNKYVNQAIELSRRLPNERLIVNMIAHNAISVQDGMTLLLELGFTQNDAAAIVKTGTASRTATHKTLTQATIVQLYSEGVIARDTAVQQIQAIGLSSTDAQWIIAAEDAKLAARERQASIAKIRTSYVGHKIDESTAERDLLAIGVDHNHASRLATLWSVEREANRRSLTEAQIIKIAQAGLISPSDASSRLQGLGLTAGDASLVLKVNGLEAG